MREQEINKLLENYDGAFYVYDIGKLKQRISFLRSSMPNKVSLCYAVKANTFVVKEIEKDLDRFEICSPGEANICRKLGVDTEKMVISGVYKTPSVIENMIKDKEFKGIYTVESMHQFEILCKFSEKYGRNVKVLLRLTNDSQFGINEEDIFEIIKNRETVNNIDILGIQYFSGTQKQSVKKLKRELTHLDEFLKRLEAELSYTAKELEYGTGFPVMYFEADEFNEEEFFKEFSELINSMEYRGKITLEIGRSMVAACGEYYTRVVDMKTNKGQNYLLIDGGMHQLVYYGQHMAMKQPYFAVCGKEKDKKDKLWNICGSLCSMNDIIVKQAAMPDIKIGDTLVFKNVGAYCSTEGISLFLSRDLPTVYLLNENKKIITVRSRIETEVFNTPNYERK